MSRKVKFPLKMANEAQVRTLEELRENFDLASVLGYYDNGRLIEWLADRYYEEEAGKINVLDKSSSDFKKSLCEILGVPYSEDEAGSLDLADISAKNERRERLKQFTADDKILAAVDSVAFSQEELADLLDDDVKIIYLCGERFKIPGSKEGVTYIGVNNPIITPPEGFVEKSIVLKNVEFDPNDFIKLAKAAPDPVQWWRRAAEAGFAEAQFNLGKCYENGEGIEKNHEEAVKWYRKAADQGIVKARTQAHLLYLTMRREYIAKYQMCISSSKRGSVGLKSDGTVIAVGIINKTQDWRDIVAISAGNDHTVGLKSDGTVVVRD